MTRGSSYALTVLLVVGLLPASASAEPQFAIRYASYSGTPVRCTSCHVNPTGGGLRNALGRNVFVESLMAMKALNSSPTQWRPTAGKDDWVTYGGDLRILYLRRRSEGVKDLEFRFPQPGEEQDGVLTTSQGFFFPMEIELEAAFSLLDDELTIHVPLGFPNLELTATYTGVPWDGWVRGGRFFPSYGLRTANHTMYHRAPLGYGPLGQDIGLEAGFHPTDNTRVIANVLVGKEPCQVQWEEARVQEFATRPSDVVCDTGTTRHWKQDDMGNWYAKLEAPFIFFGQGAKRPVQAATLIGDITLRPRDNLTLFVGGSTYFGYFDDAKVFKGGPYLMANLGKGADGINLTYVAELDWMTISPLEPATVSLLVSYQELTFTPLQGLDLIASFETYDPDTGKDGDGITRIGAGVQLFPHRWADLRVHYRFTTGDLDLNHRADERDLFSELHVFF